MEFPGRVKNTSDQRSYFPCSFGGGLDKAVSKYQEHDGKKADAHHTMQIGPEDAPTEDGHCVSEIADGVSRNGLAQGAVGRVPRLRWTVAAAAGVP